MNALGTVPELFTHVVTWMCWLAALAAAVNAVEMLTLHREGRVDRVWNSSALQTEWGVFAVLLSTRAFAGIQIVQLIASLTLAQFSGTSVAAFSGLTLCATTLLAAMRFRGTVNGGSDGMLFTVLCGLTLAQWPSAPDVIREGGVLYVAAQVTLSYVRAGVVKAREREWWTGEALRAFLQLRAYGVPTWVQSLVTRRRALLVASSMGVIGFECLAPLAWWSPTVCALFIVTAVCFHTGAAVVFGLNRFLLAWGAALPALWFAVHRVG